MTGSGLNIGNRGLSVQYDGQRIEPVAVAADRVGSPLVKCACSAPPRLDRQAGVTPCRSHDCLYCERPWEQAAAQGVALLAARLLRWGGAGDRDRRAGPQPLWALG